jgi:hypothetical protein
MAGSAINPAAPSFSASRAKSTARFVVSSETPAITGLRPPRGFDGRAQHRALFVRLERIVFADRAQHHHAVDAVGAARSSSRSASNWVVAAGNTPAQPGCVIAMASSRISPARRTRHRGPRTHGPRAFRRASSAGCKQRARLESV